MGQFQTKTPPFQDLSTISNDDDGHASMTSAWYPPTTAGRPFGHEVDLEADIEVEEREFGDGVKGYGLFYRPKNVYIALTTYFPKMQVLGVDRRNLHIDSFFHGLHYDDTKDIRTSLKTDNFNMANYTMNWIINSLANDLKAETVTLYDSWRGKSDDKLWWSLMGITSKDLQMDAALRRKRLHGAKFRKIDGGKTEDEGAAKEQLDQAMATSGFYAKYGFEKTTDDGLVHVDGFTHLKYTHVLRMSARPRLVLRSAMF